MSKIPSKPLKRPKYSQNLKNDWNTPETYIMIEMVLKLKKWLKYPRNLKNDQNTFKT